MLNHHHVKPIFKRIPYPGEGGEYLCVWVCVCAYIFAHLRRKLRQNRLILGERFTQLSQTFSMSVVYHILARDA